MLHRVFQYAQPHSRARARIGAMPDQVQWQHIAAARDVDTMIQRMRDHGLARWVTPLPRSPDTHAIESALRQGIVILVNDVCRWLPGRWRNVKRWLRTGASLALLPELLRNPVFEPPDGSPEVLRQIAAQPLATRRDALHLAGYARYLQQDPAQILAVWLQDFDTACPRMRGNEDRAVMRIRQMVHAHVASMRSSRAHVRETGWTAESSQWRLREHLSDRLRAQLGYESFHGGLLLIYALLEMLQFERCRALLLARVQGWDAAGVV